MRPSDVLARAGDYLERHDVENALPTAELLLAHVLGVDRARLYTRDDGLTTAEAKAFGRSLCSRCTGTPVQHLTGRQGFRRLDLLVEPGVFIPRPETEMVAERALAMIADISAPLVVDVGTGTGAIALSIKDERSDAVVYATDIAEPAVALARENAKIAGMHIEVMRGDLLDPLPGRIRGRIDLVVSNPPYVPKAEHADLPPHVLADPESALVGDLATFRRLFAAAAGWLRPGGALVVEIGSDMSEAVSELAAETFAEVEVGLDLTGRDRFVSARLRGP